MRDGDRFEQDAEEWWRAAAACLRAVVDETRNRGRIEAVSVSATSGTICLLDGAGLAIRPAMMYADGRSQIEAERINAVAGDLRERLGYRFNSSWGLPKLLWLHHHEPEQMGWARFFAHAGDVITGRLCGEYGVTDATQALKSGFDLIEWRWPEFIEQELGLPVARLPRVVASSTPIGVVTPEAASETGLPAGGTVVAGMTDGCASQVAGGAIEPGQWLSVLGTTLVVKGVSKELPRDPAGRVYSHHHPEGFWLPGAASNTGGGALARWAAEEWSSLDRQAAQLSPTGLAVYPLRQQGERFPFVRPAAQGFVEGDVRSDQQLYAATLEGIGYLERLGYEVLEQLGATVGPVLRTAGGGGRSKAWSQIRANILGRAIAVPAEGGAAFGAAILAAMAGLHPDLATATREMVRVDYTVMPRQALAGEYEAGYARFLDACRRRGYLEETGAGQSR
jgi:xylulokinase